MTKPMLNVDRAQLAALGQALDDPAKLEQLGMELAQDIRDRADHQLYRATVDQAFPPSQYPATNGPAQCAAAAKMPMPLTRLSFDFDTGAVAVVQDEVLLDGDGLAPDGYPGDGRTPEVDDYYASGRARLVEGQYPTGPGGYEPDGDDS